MIPSANPFNVYGQAYAVYVLVKWLILTASFFVLSCFEGFSLLWMLWWPCFGAPALISIYLHRLYRKKLL